MIGVHRFPLSWLLAGAIGSVPGAQDPVEAVLSVDPARARPGGAIDVLVEMRIAPAWHVYPLDEAPAHLLPTRLDLALPSGLEPASDWKATAPRRTPEGPVLEGTVRFERRVRIAREAQPGKGTIRCEVRYQACDPSVCLPPQVRLLESDLEILSEADRHDLSILYLGNLETPRARAYEAFLRERFAVVRVSDRDRFDPASVGEAEVVLLDWSQGDVDLGKMASIRSPLGERERWSKPTVLLGSAGLLLASPWRTNGAYG